jgi:hypothetical protein
MNMKQGKVRVEMNGKTYHVEPMEHGAIFEEDSDGTLMPAKGLTAEQEARLRAIAQTRKPPSAR